MHNNSVLRALQSRWWVILLLASVGAFLAALPDPSRVAGQSQPSGYSATHTLLVNNPDTPAGADVSPTQFALFATNGEVPARVAKKLGFTGDPAVLASEVAVSLDATTGALTFTTVQSTPDAAVAIADAFADETNSYLVERQDALYQDRLSASLNRLNELKTELDTLTRDLASSPEDSVLLAQRDAVARQYSVAFEQSDVLSASPGTLTFTTLESAHAVPVVSKGLSAPRSRVVRAGLGAIVGAAIGFGAAVVLSRLDRRIRTREQAEEVMGMRARVLVPKVKDDRRSRLAVTTGSNDTLSDAYRTLRNVVGFILGNLEPANRARVTVIVSPGPSEGKTSLTVNLAAAFAETGQCTIAVNADFRRPQLASWLIEPTMAPLPFFLDDLEWLPPQRLLRETLVPNLSLLDLTGLGSAGELARATATLIPRLGDAADSIVVDTSPVGATADVLELVPLADLIVVIARAGRTTIEAAQQTVGILRDISSAPLILVLTGIKQERADHYHRRVDPKKPSLRQGGASPDRKVERKARDGFDGSNVDGEPRGAERVTPLSERAERGVQRETANQARPFEKDT